MSHRTSNGFVSDGRNPNWEPVCNTCPHFEKEIDTTGGWCQHPRNRVPPMPGWPNGFTPSVSINGGCYLHPNEWRATPTAPQGAEGEG